jgi:glyoxylate/hydroxypyruvate reductase
MKPLVPFIHGLNAQEEGLWLEALRAASPALDIVAGSALTAEQKQAAKVAILANPDPVKLNELPNLIWVHSLWAGVEKLMPLVAGRDLKVARLVDDVLTQTMSEAVLAWTLYLHRDMPRYRAQQSARQWQQWPVPRPQERKIGVLGLGELGAASASRLATNGFDVLGWSRSQKSVPSVTCFSGEAGLEAILAQSDIVVVLLPATPETMGLLNGHRLGQMKAGASLINFARGAILDHDALVAQLNTGQLAHAVLDVFVIEPLPTDSPLWVHPKITILPHISAPTNKESAAMQVTHAVEAWFANGSLPPFVEVGRGY